MTHHITIVAGEASGDMHDVRLVDIALFSEMTKKVKKTLQREKEKAYAEDSVYCRS